MRKTPHPIALAAAGTLCLAAAAPAAAAPGTGLKGPTTTVAPYVLPTADGVQTTSLLTVGDQPAGNGYKMVGIPDGLGARTGSGNAVEILMNHELGSAVGAVRAHGQTGSFVAKLKVDKTTLAVTEGSDLIDSPSDVTYYDYPAAAFGPNPSPAGGNPLFAAQSAAFNRFCSATLTAPGQMLNPVSGNGYAGQIFFGNEEGGNNSRTFGILDDGTTRQLPRLGLFSWENTIPAANRTDTTLVQGQEDAAAGQLWTYVGTKTNAANPFAAAGLENGVNHVADVVDQTVATDAQFRATYGKGVPAPVTFNAVDFNQPADAQNTEAATDGITLNRVEDGHWDPSNPRDFYFVTTDGGDNASVPGSTVSRNGGGLWRLRYKDIENPLAGATLTLLLDGSEAPYLSKPDNMAIDTHGNLLIQEDPGGNDALARIVAYDIATGRRGVVATFDPALFSAAANTGTPAAPRTTDEESSGIIDAKDTFGDGKFLFDAQVHRARTEPELVEEGQLLLLEVTDFEAVYSGRAVIKDGATGPAGPQGPSGAPGRRGRAVPRARVVRRVPQGRGVPPAPPGRRARTARTERTPGSRAR